MNALLIPSFFMLAGVLCLIGLAHMMTPGQHPAVKGGPPDGRSRRRGVWRAKLVILAIGAAVAFAAAALFWT